MSNQIFGPVPSRRLGRSLGVDLVLLKTCTYDCIYCQRGRTTCKTMERKEWVPLDGVLEKLKDKLPTKPDYIILSGSGEPTLYSRIDELIDRIKAMTDVPVTVLTNGSLLWHEDVRRQLMNADLVIPSLDAGDEAMFRLVNRPHEEISFEQMFSGLIDFRRDFRGEYWLFSSARGGDSSSRLSVLFPASALPRSRSRARSCPVGSFFPASTAISGSCRNWSWSTRSSYPKATPYTLWATSSATVYSMSSGSR